MFSFRFFFQMLVGLVALPVLPVSAIEENEVIIFNRVEVVINAPAVKVWADNLERPTYKRLNNLHNQVGEKSRFYVPDSEGNPVAYYGNEITCLIEGRLVCHKVVPELNPANNLVLYSAEVIPQGENKTLLRMDIHRRTELGGDEPLGEPEILRLKREMEAAYQAVYEQRFAAR